MVLELWTSSCAPSRCGNPQEVSLLLCPTELCPSSPGPLVVVSPLQLHVLSPALFPLQLWCPPTMVSLLLPFLGLYSYTTASLTHPEDDTSNLCTSFCLSFWNNLSCSIPEPSFLLWPLQVRFFLGLVCLRNRSWPRKLRSCVCPRTNSCPRTLRGVHYISILMQSTGCGVLALTLSA